MILERQTSGLVKQKVFIFLETLVEILKIIWDIFQKQMNFNLVWFLPTVTFPALRKSQCGRKEDAFEMKNPQLESTKRRNLNEMQQPVAQSAGR